MSTPSIQTLITQAQQVLNLKSSNEIRATLAAILANANVGTPLNPNLTTQQLWDEFYEIVRQPTDDIESIITDQMMRLVFSPPAPGGAGADKQVIFNDGGVLAGDSEFLWDKSANRLDVNGTAIITSGLTVRTDKLKVDSNGVGIGTASPGAGYVLDVVGAARITAANGLVIDKAGAGFVDFFNSGNSGANVGTSGIGGLTIYTANGIGGSYGVRYVIDSTGISTWSVAGTTAMTLDTTGLGIGMSPLTSSKLSLFGGTGDTSAADTISSLSRTSSTGNVLGGKLVLTAKDTAFGNLVFRIKTTASSAESSGYYTDALTIDGEKGNVGIGVTPSAWGSGYKSVQVNEAGGFAGKSDGLIAAQNCYFNGTNWVNNRASTFSSRYDMNVAGNGIHAWYVYGSSFGTVGNTIPFTQAMTLDASGNLFIKKTASALGTVGIENAAAGYIQSTVTSDASLFCNRLATDGETIKFYRQTLQVGNISVTTTATAYNTSSDYRLKEDAQPLVGGLARVNALKPSIYKWKVNGSTGEGFIAHELADVVPFAVTGDKDAVDADNKPTYQGVDLSKIVPILVAAIQELTAEVNALKNA